MVAILPPAEKLPLAVRKDLRDSWDAKKADLEKELSTALGGVAWTIDINPNAIYPYAQEKTYMNRAPGGAIKAYVSGVIYMLGRFKYEYGAPGIADLNDLCHAHVLTMDVDADDKFPCHGMDVTDGKLRILFTPDRIDNNIDDAAASPKLEKALNAVTPLPASWDSILSFAARSGLFKYYHEKIGDVREEISTLIKNPDIKLTPNFEDSYSKLKAAADKGSELAYKDWEERLGGLTQGYFSGVASTLRYKNFHKDEMLWEGFNDAVSKSEIAFRIVDAKGLGGVAIENGVLYVQTTAEQFGRNVGDAADKIVDLL